VVAGGAGAARAVLALRALLAAIPASELAIAVVHRLVTGLLGPRRLPRLELKAGVPARLRTLLVMPALLGDEASRADLVERLEVHYLANPDGDIRFALLTDWPDAPEETSAADEASLSDARRRIRELNQRHGAAPGGGHRV